MTLASRLLHSTPPPPETLLASSTAAGEQKQASKGAIGRPGGVSARVKRAVNLPLVSGAVNRYVEVDLSGNFW